MKLILHCVAAALGLSNTSTYHSQAPAIERLEVTHYITHHVAVSAAPAPPPCTSIFTPPSAVAATTRAATYDYGPEPFDVPAVETRSSFSAASLFYAVGEWGSTPITTTPFQILVSVFVVVLVGLGAYCCLDFARYNRAYIRYLQARATARRSICAVCRLTSYILLHACNGILALARTAKTSTTALYHYLRTTAPPLAMQTHTSLLLPALQIIYPRLRSLLHALAVYLARKTQVQEHLNTLHLFYLYLTIPVSSPTHDLALQAASTTLPERMRIMQQNDALHAEITALRNEHSEVVQKMQRRFERELGEGRGARGGGWVPVRSYVDAVHAGKCYGSTGGAVVGAGAPKGLFYQETIRRVRWQGCL